MKGRRSEEELLNADSPKRRSWCTILWQAQLPLTLPPLADDRICSSRAGSSAWAQCPEIRLLAADWPAGWHAVLMPTPCPFPQLHRSTLLFLMSSIKMWRDVGVAGFVFLISSYQFLERTRNAKPRSRWKRRYKQGCGGYSSRGLGGSGGEERQEFIGGNLMEKFWKSWPPGGSLGGLS